MNKVELLNIKIFADGADLKSMLVLAEHPLVKGFTTNPSLMRKDGVTNYEKFARALLKSIPHKPISFEIFADDFLTMEAQARQIAAWGTNVYVKIPVTNTQGTFTGPLISKLSREGIPVNVTAILTLDQVRKTTACLYEHTPSIVSIFAGRISDTGIDPIPMMVESTRIVKSKPNAEILWASTRQLLNIFQAEEAGCSIITVTHDQLKKISLIGKDLNSYSLETVLMFYKDAIAAGFTIDTRSESVELAFAE